MFLQKESRICPPHTFALDNHAVDGLFHGACLYCPATKSWLANPPIDSKKFASPVRGGKLNWQTPEQRMADKDLEHRLIDEWFERERGW